jgi:hypothetical protein
MKPKKKTGRRLKRDALDMFPALRALGDFKVKTDKDFTREATGAGSIEYFSPDTPKVTYETGLEVKNPSRGRKPAVLVNPESNDAQDVALDLLHGLPDYDPQYRDLRERFAESIGDAEIRYFYNMDGGDEAYPDGYEQFRDNFIDGKIRNFLFEGTEEDFDRARYNPTERQDLNQVNPEAFKVAMRIRNYLKT